MADYGAGTLALLPNERFRQALKAAPGSRHNPVREDWLAELSLHVSPVSMRRQAEYQKRGGDKSAELFALKDRPGERYDVTFFYEVIAPELLSGLSLVPKVLLGHPTTFPGTLTPLGQHLHRTGGAPPSSTSHARRSRASKTEGSPSRAW